MRAYKCDNCEEFFEGSPANQGTFAYIDFGNGATQAFANLKADLGFNGGQVSR